MKRTLSLVLALVMILGTFSTVFAVELDDAADFLADEGILLGDDDGDLMLEENLKRRDAVVLLSRLFDVEEDAKEFEAEGYPTWEDNDDPHYDGYLAWAEVNEYFEGDDEGNFNPEDAITSQEFALVLIRALGYEANGHESWEAAFEQAEELGLLEDAEVEEKEAIVRGQMAILIYNALGTEMNDSDETLAEFLGIEMPEEEITELEVEEVYAENLMEVVIELSNADLADEVQLENPANYSINRDIKVVDADLVGDEVILLLQGGIQNAEIKDAATEMVRNRQYELTIKGIDRDVNGKYKFTARDNSIPVVESVEVLGEYGIKVTTSEPVRDPQERDFYIDGSRESMILEQYGRDIILTPYHNEEFDEDAEELEIRALEDYANYRSTAAVFDIEIIEDDEAPEVVEAYFYDGEDKVYVVFDKDIYEDSVEAQGGRTLGNASYEEGRRTFYAKEAEKFDTNVAVYTFNDEWDEDNELLIQGVENHSQVAMERTSIVAEERGKASDAAAVLTNNDKRQVLYTEDNTGEGVIYEPALVLELEFDKDILSKKVDGVEVPDVDFDKDFVVYEKYVNNNGQKRAANDGIKVTGVEFDGKDRDVLLVSIIKLRVNDEDKSYDYILEVDNLVDSKDNDVARDYMDFEVKPGSDSDFGIDSIIVDSSRNYLDFVIDFNDEVDRDNARDARNYIFLDGNKERDLEELDGEAIVDRDGEFVTLRLPIIDGEDQEEFFEDYDGLRILQRVRNLDGDRLSAGDLEWTFDLSVYDGTDVEKITVK